jgi:hypothetical protein
MPTNSPMKSTMATAASPAGSYAWWRLAAENLLVPLAALMQPGKADLPLRRQASNDERGVAIQPLLGFEHVKANESDPQMRLHFLARNLLALTAESKRASGEQDLMALVWTGLNAKEREPWKVVSTSKGKLKLCHPVRGEWRITDPELPKLPA